MMRHIDTLFPLEVKKSSLDISASSAVSLSASLITQDPTYLNDTSSEKNFGLYTSSNSDLPSKDTIPPSKKKSSSISNLIDDFLKDSFDGPITLRNPPLPTVISNSNTPPMVGSMGKMGPLESPGKKVSMVHTGPLESPGKKVSMVHTGPLVATRQMGSMVHTGPSVATRQAGSMGQVGSMGQLGSMGQVESMEQVESPEPRRSAPVSKRVSKSGLSNALRADIRKDRANNSSCGSLKTSSSKSPPFLVNDIGLNSSPDQTSNF